MLNQYPESETFRFVADLDFPEYQQIIKEPIALDTIKLKLNAHKVSTNKYWFSSHKNVRWNTHYANGIVKKIFIYLCSVHFQYPTISSFLSDVRRMFENCRTFNSKENKHYKRGVTLEKHMHKTLEVRKLNYENMKLIKLNYEFWSDVWKIS